MEARWSLTDVVKQLKIRQGMPANQVFILSRWHLFYLLYHDVWQSLLKKKKKGFCFKCCFDKLMDGSLFSPNSFFPLRNPQINSINIFILAL